MEKEMEIDTEPVVYVGFKVHGFVFKVPEL